MLDKVVIEEIPTEEHYQMNSSVTYFEFFANSTSDCDKTMRTYGLKFFFFTKLKIVFKNVAIS